jgi:glycosyltransferase involved in cell wall biosynthesis
MKVLIVSLQKQGGGALDGLELSNGLAANGFAHAAVISAGNEYAARWDAHADKRTVAKIPTYGSSMKSFLLATIGVARPLRLVRTLAASHADIVHVADFHPWAAFIYLARPFFKYTIVYAPQDNPFDPKEKARPFMAPMERWFVRRADAVAAYSEFMKRDIANYVKRDIDVVPLGVYGDLASGIADKKKFHMSGPLNVLFFGRIEPYKGVDVLVRAAEILKQKKADVRMVIAGRGAIDAADLESIKKLDVELHNAWITDDELRGLVAHADVLVAPYKKATQSGIVSVGLACRVPVVATDVGSFREYIEDSVNGFIVPPEDPAALAARIEMFANDRALLVKMSHGAAAVAQKYSWANIAKTAIALYGRIAA